MRRLAVCNGRAKGFSLIEMAVALVILAMVFTIAINLVIRASAINDRAGAAAGGVESAGALGAFDPALIDAAIEGFMRARHRLPCPDNTGDGLENCLDGATPVALGALPLATLQIAYPPEQSWRLPIAYGIYRGAAPVSDLGQALPARFTTIPYLRDDSPACPPGTADADCDVPEQDVVSNPVILLGSDQDTLNVLDSCQALSNAAQEASTFRANLLHSGTSAADTARANVAYAFAWSSTPSLLAGSDLLESRQNGDPLRFYPSGFSPPGSDDLTRVRSFGDLRQGLDCVDRFGDVAVTYNASASLMTSEYLNRVRLAHMKIFYADAEDSVSAAERDIVFAAIDVALAAAGLLLSIAEGTQGNPVAVANIVVMVAELANATAGLALAIIDLEDAKQFRDEVADVLAQVRVRLNIAGDLMQRAQNVGLTVQQRGQL